MAAHIGVPICMSRAATKRIYAEACRLFGTNDEEDLLEFVNDEIYRAMPRPATM